MMEFNSFGHFLQAVAHSELNPHAPDRRLQTRGYPGPAGASEQVPADGGFLVPQEFARQLIERVFLDEVVGRCFQLPLVRNSIAFPQLDEASRKDGSRFGGAQAYWQDEADQLIGTKPRFGRGELTAKKLTVLTYLTDELLEDSAADALDVFARAVASQELRFRITDAIVNGTGAGMPQGILTSNALIQIPKSAGQASATIVAGNVISMWQQCWAASRPNAVWLCHPDAEAQLLMLTIPVGTGGSSLQLYHPARDGERYNTMLGRPVVAIEQAPALGSPGDLLLCDLSRYVLAMREISQAVSVHVSFLTDQTAFRWVLRCDGQTIDNRALTPFTGSNLVSPFTCVAQR
jgi:HK97 family phage major capsid protein